MSDPYKHVQVVSALEAEIKALQQENERLRAAMQEFVDRRDRGEVRSRYTYAKFKQLLEAGGDE